MRARGSCARHAGAAHGAGRNSRTLSRGLVISCSIDRLLTPSTHWAGRNGRALCGAADGHTWGGEEQQKAAHGVGCSGMPHMGGEGHTWGGEEELGPVWSSQLADPPERVRQAP